VVSTLARAREVMRRLRPVAVILDIRLHGEDTWGFLTEVKRREESRDIPVLVVTTVADQHKGLGLGADAYAVKPVERVWLLDTLAQVTGPERRSHVLVIDDDETSRYLVRSSLADSAYVVVEAVDGRDGLRRAREVRPVAIFLDLVMPGYSGFEVLEQLREDAATRAIPVIVLTSKVLAPADAAWLRARAAAVLSKAQVARDTVSRALAHAVAGQPEEVQ
jgi:CheY-like chemotaxis protein